MTKKLLLTFFLTFTFAINSYAQPDPCLGTTNPLTVSFQTINDACDCNGAAQVFVTGGTTPYTYSWSFNSLLNTPNAYGLCPGIYVVTVTDANGCYSATSVVINGGLISSNIILTPTQPSCGQNNGVITTAISSGSPSGGYTFMWSNGSTTINQYNLSVGTYCLTVTDFMGCFATQCVTLQATFNTNYQPATCGLCNGSIEISDSSTYFISTGTGITQVVTGPATLTGLCPGYYDLFSELSNCQSAIQLENIDLPFTANANFNTSLGNAGVLNVCTGQPIQFAAPDGNLSVLWNFGEPTSAGNTSNLPNATYTYENTGTYTVTLITQGCTDADTLQRTIIVEQGIAPDIECASLVCPGVAQTYTTNVVCDTYNWSVTGGSITAGQNTAEITVVWTDVAMGTVALTVGDCDGSTICNPVGSINVPIVSNNIPISGPDVVCANTNAVYSVTQYGGVQYNWSVSPPASGTVLWQQYNQAGIHWNSTDGTVQVSMSSNLVACNAVNAMPVEVNQVYNLSGPETACTGQSLSFAASTGLHNWTVSGSATITAGGSNSSTVTVQAGSGAGFIVSATPVDVTQYCDYPQQISVEIAPQPATPLITGATTICPGNAYTYQIAAPASGLNYQWAVTGGTPASGSGTALTIVWQSGSPTYGISVIAQSMNEPFCQSDAGTLGISPVQTLLVSGDDELCAGDKANYSASPLLADVDYTWVVSPPEAGSVISGQGSNSVQVQWNSGYAAAVLQATACAVSVQHNITLHQPVSPVITASGNLCAGSSIGLSITPATYTAYAWSTSAIAPAITVSAGGDYVVSVTDANGCTANATLNVHQYPLPDASISAEDINTICSDAPNDVNISALVGDGYTYQWSLNGSAFGGSVTTVTHTGSAAVANFNYSVQVTDAYGCQNTSNIVTIIQDVCNFNPGSCPGGTCPNPGGGGGGGTCAANPAEVLGIVADTPYCYDVSFQNISTGGLSYTWDFGDGSPNVTLPDTSPQTHTYTEPGFYTVKIFGTYANLNPIPTNCIYMSYEMVEIPLISDFDFISPCINTATQFTDRSRHSTGTTITSWNWDFGDTNTSTDTNPTHTFAAAGTYNVTLTIGNGLCTHTITQPVTIYNLPDASFTLPATVCEGSPAIFTPAANPNAIRWDWDFGDAATVSTQNPEHTYLQDGTYTATLTVTDNKGCSNTYSQSITVLPVDNGAIALSNPNACEGQTITLSAPSGIGFEWSDASTGSTLDVTQTGNFNVTITQANGCQYSTPFVQVNFAPLPPAVVSPAALNLCPGTTATLSANAGTGFAYAWSSGPNNPAITINYNAVPPAGSTLYVTVTDSATGCANVSAPVSVQAIVLPAPGINPNFAAALQLCEGETLDLSATHPTLNNFEWNNGQSGSNITVSAGGNYSVMVTDANGCTAAASVSVGMNSGGDLAAIPVGCYDYCENEPFFIPNVYAAYQWLFNGAPIAGANTPDFIPDQSGDYQLQITTPFGCQDTSDVLSLNLIDCLACDVSAGFTFAFTCTGVQFTSIATGNGTLSYSWDFDDSGATDNIANPLHQFSGYGTYQVCLTASNLAADGDTCTQVFCQDVLIDSSNALSITVDAIQAATCGQTDGGVSVSVSGDAIPYTFIWSNSSPTEDLTQVGAGIYTLTVTDNNGCTATATAEVTALLPAPALNCLSATDSSLTVSWSGALGASGYEISIAGGATISLDAATSEYTFTGLASDQSYSISLTALAPANCGANQTATQTCSTLPNPCLNTTLSIQTNAIQNAICGQSNGAIDIGVSGGALPYAYEWSDGSASEDITQLAAGSYTVTVSDANGCTATADAAVNAPLSNPELNCLSATANSLTVLWTFEPGAVGYELSIDGNTPQMMDATDDEFTFINLEPDQTYTISLTAIAMDGCGNSETIATTCSTAPPDCIPDAIYAAIQANATNITQGETVELSVQTDGLNNGLTYVWTANGLPLSCTDSLCVFMPDATTNYAVTITDEYGCFAEAELIVEVRMPNKALIPNAFSPNGDGINNTFRIAGFNVAELNFSIWNRWGEKMYDSGFTPDLNTGWDGKYKGKDCELGVYVYKAYVRYTDGSEELLKGNVTLIR